VSNVRPTTAAAAEPREAGEGEVAHTEAARHGWRVLAILSVLMGFASISTDLYLPAMPTMGIALHTSPGAIEWTISGYLIGFSIGQLFWGPLSDRLGRRVPIAVGLILFVIGASGCALSGDAASMIVWRIVQALGASAGVTLGRAMVRDLYKGEQAARMMSTLMTVMAIAPLLGPIVGGQILVLVSWRVIFWTLVGIGLLTLAALFTLPETLPEQKRNAELFARAFVSYPALMRDRCLVAYAGVGGFFYGGMFAYIAGTPFAYITYHHVPPQLYGLLFAAGILGVMATNMMNACFVAHVGSDRLLRWGATAAACVAIAAAIAARTDWGGLFALAVPLFLFASMTGFIVANSIVGALAIFPQRVGAVSALIGASQYGSGVIGSALVGAFADGTPWPLGWVVAACGIGAALCACALKSNDARIACAQPTPVNLSKHAKE
jgi:MFS transporter, DHA1 family, multidrug resistance protein